MAEPGQAIETELKLALTPAAEKLLPELGAFRPPRASEPETKRIVTTYFDTPNRDLARRGLSLRVRRTGKRRTQTVKASGDGGTAMTRGEWEWPLSKEEPDLSLAASSPVGNDLPTNVALVPVVVTDVVRTTRMLNGEGTKIEAAIDSGSILAGGAKEPVHELELELREGSPGALYRLALTLHAASPLAVEVESKVSRGLRLNHSETPRSHKASAPGFDPRIRAQDALGDIVGSALGHLLANRAPAMAGDIEGIHQARVAIRRLRSGLKLFEPRLEPHAAALFQNELKRLGQVIGEARDWDVFCDEALPESLGDGNEEDLGALIRNAADDRRRAADAVCARELSATSFTSLVLGLAAWAETGRERPCVLGEGLKKRLARIAPSLLGRLARKVRKRSRGLRPGAAPEMLHPLRKSLKKLRYGVEFFAPLYPRKVVKRFLTRVKALQKSLGVINDSAMATRLAQGLAVAGRFELGPPLSAVALSREQARRKATRKLARSWAAFQRQEFFWE
jgi:inorganic triphosphatase YgiF